MLLVGAAKGKKNGAGPQTPHNRQVNNSSIARTVVGALDGPATVDTTPADIRAERTPCKPHTSCENMPEMKRCDADSFFTAADATSSQPGPHSRNHGTLKRVVEARRLDRGTSTSAGQYLQPVPYRLPSTTPYVQYADRGTETTQDTTCNTKEPMSTRTRTRTHQWHRRLDPPHPVAGK